MQLIVFSVLTVVAQAKIHLRDHSALSRNVKSKSERNMDECVEFFTAARARSPWLSQDRRTWQQAIEYGTDQCAVTLSPSTADSTYICKHFREFMTDSFIDFIQTKPLTVEQVCKHTEYHLAELKVQTVNMPNVAGDNSTIEEFFVHGDCPSAIQTALHGRTGLPKSEVPDFWYTFCVSQDCAHYLPSRHRWCEINHAPSPTHSNAICLLVQEFAKENLHKIKEAELGPRELCALYAGFMSEVHINSDAYEYVIHAGSKKDIPDPKDPEKALVHSQLINAATGHFIRDNMAHPVRPQHDSGTATLRGFSAMLLAVAGLLIRG